MSLPEKVAKSENQNADTGKLYNRGQVSVEFFHEISKHGRHGERSYSHDKVGCGDQGYDAQLPIGVPILYNLSLEIPNWKNTMCI